MKNVVVIHSTGTPEGEMVTMEDIMNLYSEDKHGDPLPFHYVIDIKGGIMKGKKDSELCGHCGRWSRDSLSVGIMGGVRADGSEGNTMNEKQEEALVFLLKQFKVRCPEVKVKGCNEVLHPGEKMEENEPYFDVEEWWRGFL